MKYKLNKYVLGILAITFALTSCSKTSDELAAVVNTQTDSTKMSKIRGDNKYDVLGFGCDVTGPYLDQMKNVYPVLDIASLFADNYIVYDNNVHTNVIINGGVDLKTLTTKLSAKIASTASIPLTDKTVFTGGFESEFITANTVNTKYSYAYVDVNCYYYHCALKPYIDYSILRQHLSTDFKNDLLSLTSDQIVAKYGTHVYTDIYTGGQLHCKYKSCITKTNDELTIKAGANAGIKDICNLSASGSYTKSTAAEYNDESMECTVVGGENRAPFTWTPGSGVTFNIDTWSQTVKESTLHGLQLIDIADQSLVAIYEFVDDPVKKASLKTAVDNYILSKKLNIILVEPLYRYWNKSTGNHFYTTDKEELGFNNSSWVYEGVAAYVSATQQSNMVPFYRFCKNIQIFLGPKYIDHYYTCLKSSGSSYTLERDPMCYVYSTQINGTVPLKQYYNSSKYDHFYCVYPSSESLSAYSYNGDCCYVFPGTR